MEQDIYITGGGREIRIPGMPEEIEFESGGTKLAEYDVLDKGEVVVPNGKNLRTYSWTCLFPGEDRANYPFMRGEWQPPIKYQTILSFWKAEGTKLHLIITGTPINADVYLSDYEVGYGGGMGDFECKMKFIDAEDITITSANTTAVNENTNNETKRSEDVSSTKSHTVVSGDTLWSIAEKYLGSGAKWTEIYEKNKEIIEQTAKDFGRSSSDNGHWIYPGCKLAI